MIETPTTGCLHPAYPGYFSSPAEYMRWYEREGPVRDPKAPTGEGRVCSAQNSCCVPRGACSTRVSRLLFDSDSKPMPRLHTYPIHPPHSPTPPPSDAVGILLYRKHVITDQPYISQLIETMEAEGLRPLPIFINGVEAHTVVGACRVLLGGCGWMAPTVRAGKRSSVPAGCVR